MTELIRGLYNLKPTQCGCVLTIGNFDGVHLGHQQLVSSVIKKAAALNTSSLVMTFEPHPIEFFTKGNSSIPRITRFREKFSALRELNVDFVLNLTFNQVLANLSATDFVRLIVAKIRPQAIIVGEDFHYGRNRKGNIQTLRESGLSAGFDVIIANTIELQGERISSTRLRNALLSGDLALAQRLLGRPYQMQGRVRGGDKRGREWGFPTANIHLHRNVTPLNGIFTVLMHGIEKHPIPGAANIGMRPTVGGTHTLLEVHLLNFNRQIYGSYVSVEFCTKLRDEVRFPNIDLLKEQIANDVIAAKNYFQKQGM